MVSGRICLANGSISFVRTRRIPMVSSLAAALSDVGLDAADHPLDCEHFPDLRQLALAHAWTSLGVASWLGNAAGIRMRSDSCRNDHTAQDAAIGCIATLNRLADWSLVARQFETLRLWDGEIQRRACGDPGFSFFSCPEWRDRAHIPTPHSGHPDQAKSNLRCDNERCRADIIRLAQTVQ